MSTPGLPDFPKRSVLDRKAKEYQRKAIEHRSGKHNHPVKGCKLCREEGGKSR